jgi:hypothetical protein
MQHEAHLNGRLVLERAMEWLIIASKSSRSEVLLVCISLGPITDFERVADIFASMEWRAESRLSDKLQERLSVGAFFSPSPARLSSRALLPSHG